MFGGRGEGVVAEVIYEGEVARRKADFELAGEFAGLFGGGRGGGEEEEVAGLVGKLEEELRCEVGAITWGSKLELILWGRWVDVPLDLGGKRITLSYSLSPWANSDKLSVFGDSNLSWYPLSASKSADVLSLSLNCTTTDLPDPQKIANSSPSHPGPLVQPAAVVPSTKSLKLDSQTGQTHRQ